MSLRISDLATTRAASNTNLEAKNIVCRNINTNTATFGDITVNGNFGLGTSEPSRNVHIVSDNDSILKVESLNATANYELEVDLTKSTFGISPNLKSKNEAQIQYIYTWNTDGSMGSWYAGIGKNEEINGSIDTVNYRIGKDNELSTSYFVIDHSGNVGIGTTSPNSTAILDVSSATKGFLPPRMTAQQALDIQSPAEGLIIYATDNSGTITSKGWWGYNGSAWTQLG